VAGRRKTAITLIAPVLTFAVSTANYAQDLHEVSDKDLHLLAGTIVSLCSTSMLLYSYQVEIDPAANIGVFFSVTVLISHP